MMSDQSENPGLIQCVQDFLTNTKQWIFSSLTWFNNEKKDNSLSSFGLQLDGPEYTDPNSHVLKRMIPPEVAHLKTMKMIIFSDLENYHLLKRIRGHLSPEVFVWSFICPRPRKFYHLESYYNKYPSYTALKKRGLIHITCNIQPTKESADTVIGLVIAKLDDRISKNIKFLNVSHDTGFREIVHQMSESGRKVQILAPTRYVVSRLDFR